MKKLLLLLLPLLLLQSCFKFNTDEKVAPTIVDFNFKDYYNNAPISNMKVCITKTKFNGIFHTGGDPIGDTIDTYITDINGNLSISFQNEQSQIYNIAPVYNNGTSYGGFEEIFLQTGTKNTKTVQVRKINYFKLNLINSSHNYKKVYLSYRPEFLHYANYDGEFKDTSIVFESLPESKNNWLTIRLDSIYVFGQPIAVPNKDTLIMNFEY